MGEQGNTRLVMVTVQRPVRTTLSAGNGVLGQVTLCEACPIWRPLVVFIPQIIWTNLITITLPEKPTAQPLHLLSEPKCPAEPSPFPPPRLICGKGGEQEA